MHSGAFRSATLVSAALVLISGCTNELAPPADSEIHEAVDRFFAAYEAGDADSVATFFTEDAVLMAPGLAVTGRDRIREHTAGGMQLGRWVQSTTTESLEMTHTFGVQSGGWTMHLEATESTPPGMGGMSDSGNYMIHWRHEDGRWRIARYIANRNAAP